MFVHFLLIIGGVVVHNVGGVTKVFVNPAIGEVIIFF
jgi:hypothetical protein